MVARVWRAFGRTVANARRCLRFRSKSAHPLLLPGVVIQGVMPASTIDGVYIPGAGWVEFFEAAGRGKPEPSPVYTLHTDSVIVAGRIVWCTRWQGQYYEVVPGTMCCGAPAG